MKKYRIRLSGVVFISLALFVSGCESPYSFSASKPTHSVSSQVPASLSGCSSISNADSKKILFYAPDIYLSLNGSNNDNTFMLATQAALEQAGFSVSLQTAVDVNFDACQLYSDYSQLWLFLPCTTRQQMSATSVAAVKKYFEAGRALVVLGDNHYFDGSSLNSHCTSATGTVPFLGDSTQSSDVSQLMTDLLGARALFSTSASMNTLDPTHPLSVAWSSANGTWSHDFTLDSNGNSQMASLCGSACKNGRVLLEETDVSPARRMLFDITTYNYHSLGLTWSSSVTLPAGLATAFVGTANYFASKASSSGSGAFTAAPLAAVTSASPMPTQASLSSTDLARLKAYSDGPFQKKDTASLGTLLGSVTGQEPASQMVAPLTKLLRFPITSVRNQAASLLSKYWSQEATLPVLLIDPSGDAPQFAAGLLVKNGSPEAMTAIVSLLQHSKSDAAALEVFSNASSAQLHDPQLTQALSPFCRASVSSAIHLACMSAGL